MVVKLNFFAMCRFDGSRQAPIIAFANKYYATPLSMLWVYINTQLNCVEYQDIYGYYASYIALLKTN